MQYLFQHELQALKLLSVMSEVSPMIIKIIMKEYAFMTAKTHIVLDQKR